MREDSGDYVTANYTEMTLNELLCWYGQLKRFDYMKLQ